VNAFAMIDFEKEIDDVARIHQPSEESRMKIVLAELRQPILDLPVGPRVEASFHRVGFGGFPTMIPRVNVVLRVEAEPSEYGNHTYRVRFLNAAGQQIGDTAEKVIVFKPELPRIELVVPFAQLGIAEPGTYTFEIAIDGQTDRSIALEVFRGPPPQRVEGSAAATM